jgi:hypothetical protein
MRAFNFGTYGQTRPAKTARRTAVPCILLIRMRSQVQVLAGPPLFSQLTALPPPGRSHLLPAWAASGPHALRAVAPRPSRSRPPSAQVMVGLMPAIMSLTTCAQPCRRWANLAAYPALYRRAVPAQPAPPGRPGGRAWPLPEDLPTTTANAKAAPPLAQHGLRQLRGSGSDSGRRPAGRGYRAGRPRRLRPSSPCGCSPYRRA